MNLQRLRPMGMGDVFDEAFDLYKKNLVFFLLVTMMISIPLSIIISILRLRYLRELLGLAGMSSGSPDFTQVFSMLGVLMGGLVILAPVYLIAYGLEAGALASAASARYLGEPITVWQSYREPLRRLLPLALTALLYGLLMGAGLIFCYVGVLVPLTLLAFTAHTFTLERKSYGKALGRSNGLAAGYGSQVFGCLFLLGLITWVLDIGIEMPLNYALQSLLNIAPGAQNLFAGGGGALPAMSLQSQIVTQISSGIAGLLITPFCFCVLTVLYYDLRIRKEGFDIELLARSLHYPPLLPGGAYLPPAEAPVVPLRAAPPRAVMPPPPRSAPPPPPGLAGGPR